MSATAAGTLPATAAPRPASAGTALLLRLALTAHAAVAVAQPLLIGGYLDGRYGWLAAHSLNGSLLPALLLLTGVLALVHALAGRGPAWPVVAVAVLFLVEGLQIAMGYARVLAVHVPLGVLVVATAVALAVWSWTPRARRPRGRR